MTPQVPGGLQSQSALGLIRAALRLYRDHTAVLLGVAAIFCIPASLIQSILFRTLVGTWDPNVAIETNILVSVAILAVGSVLAVVAQVPLIWVVSRVHRGEAVSLAAALRGARIRFLPFAVTWILSSLGLVLGFTLLVIPGIILTLNWAVMPQVVVLEDVGGVRALSRSTKLVYGFRGYLGSLIFWAGALPFIVGAVLDTMLSAIFGTSPLLHALAGTLPQTLIAPLYPCVMTLAYYDLRMRQAAG